MPAHEQPSASHAVSLLRDEQLAGAPWQGAGFATSLPASCGAAGPLEEPDASAPAPPPLLLNA